MSVLISFQDTNIISGKAGDLTIYLLTGNTKNKATITITRSHFEDGHEIWSKVTDKSQYIFLQPFQGVSC